MRNFSESKTLVETFEPGKGENAEYDNQGGAMIGTPGADNTKAFHLKVFAKQEENTADCDALEWFETVFREIVKEEDERMNDEENEHKRRDKAKSRLYSKYFKTLFPEAKIKVKTNHTYKNRVYVRLKQGKRHLRSYFYKKPERAAAYFSEQLALFV